LYVFLGHLLLGNDNLFFFLNLFLLPIIIVEIMEAKQVRRVQLSHEVGHPDREEKKISFTSSVFHQALGSPGPRWQPHSPNDKAWGWPKTWYELLERE
jgi:hypothetical protein